MKYYVEFLQQQPVLANLPFHAWEETLQAAVHWGLLAPHPDMPPVLRIQPMLPYFLHSRLAVPEQQEIRQAVETAFRLHYVRLAQTLYTLTDSKEVDDRHLGEMLTDWEYENLTTALNLSLDAQTAVEAIYHALSNFLDRKQDHARGLRLGESVLARLQDYPPERLAGALGVQFVAVLHNIAGRQLRLQQAPQAELSYKRALELHLHNTSHSEDWKQRGAAPIYHQLGTTALEQRKWAEASRYYHQALQIRRALKDLPNQVQTYFQLGYLAEQTGDWAQAEEYGGQALQLSIEVKDLSKRPTIHALLGRVAQAQQQWELATWHYAHALKIYHELKDLYPQAAVFQQLGIMATAQRQWEPAQQYHQQAQEIFIRFNDLPGQSSTYHQLGILAQKQQQWAQSLQYYQQSLHIYRDFHDPFEQAMTWAQMGKLAQEQQQWTQARECFLQALSLFREAGDSQNAAITMYNLALAWKASGNADLPAAVASVVNMSAAEVEELFRQALSAEDAPPDAAPS